EVSTCGGPNHTQDRERDDGHGLFAVRIYDVFRIVVSVNVGAEQLVRGVGRQKARGVWVVGACAVIVEALIEIPFLSGKLRAGVVVARTARRIDRAERQIGDAAQLFAGRVGDQSRAVDLVAMKINRAGSRIALAGIG